MIKYRTIGQSIAEVEVLRETATSVFLRDEGFLANASGERREAKRSTYTNYHDSWLEAKQFLLNKAENELITARRALQRAQDVLGNIKGMKEPTNVGK